MVEILRVLAVMNRSLVWLALPALLLLSIGCGVLDPPTEPLDEKPVAVITATDSIPINNQLLLISSSSDPHKLALTHAWTLSQKPEGSDTDVSNTTDQVTTVCIDRPGHYTVTLRVSNSDSVNSDIATHSIRGYCVAGAPCRDNGFCAGTTVDPPVDSEGPEATITSPANGTSHTEGASIAFRGSATDPEDGNIPVGSLSWASSKKADIGVGRAFSRTDLPGGAQTITLTATDSDGNVGSDSVEITVTAVKK